MRILNNSAGAFTALLATVAGISLAATTRRIPAAVAVPKAYFVQLHQTTIAGRDVTPSSLVDKATKASVPLNVRYEFNNADVFHGLSVSLEDDAHVGVLRDLPEVADIFPVREVPRPEAQLPEFKAPSSSGGVVAVAHAPVTKRSSSDVDPSWWTTLTLPITSPANANVKIRGPGPNSAASSNGSSANFNSPHSMTGVDRLHEAGIRGKGVRIAVIDTGVDWRHPALGGCFGPGCKVEFGYDFVGDDYGSGSAPNPKPDPLATCYDGFHGTHVTGIIGMEVPSNSSVFSGLVGVAPEATLGMYRVFGCTGAAGDDGILAAMQRAVDDGADVVSMSLGEPGLWSGYPYSAVPAAATALRQKGVAVIAAAGNYGSSAPFYTEMPGNAEGALSIASVENSQFPTYPIRDSNGNKFRYGALYPFPNGDYPVVWASRGNNSGYDDYGCTAASYPSADSLDHPIESYIVVSRRGLCTLTQIQAAAAAANFSQVLTVPDPGVDNVFINGYGVATPALTGDGSIYNFGNTLDDAPLKAESSADYVLSVTSGQVSLVDQIGGGFPNNFSSVGPTSDFKLKPQLSAPGGSILSTFPLAPKSPGFGIISGTSMSTPYVSGVFALIKSHNPSLPVGEIFTLMQTSAKTMDMFNFPGLSPAAQQGAGLVQAYSAIFQSSTVSIGEVSLSLDGISSGNFTIYNPSTDAVDYTLEHTPANGMAYFPEGSTRPSQTGYTEYIYRHLTPLAFSATLSLTVDGGDSSQNSGSVVTTTIGAGKSQTIIFDIRAPSGLDPKDVPVASGFISISTSRNESLSIPYIGPAYDYTGSSDAVSIGTRPLTDADRADAWAPARDIFAVPEVYGGTDRRDMGDYRIFSFNGSDVPVTYVTTAQAAQWNRVDIVRASTNFTPTYYGYDPSVRLGNLTEPDIADNGTFGGVSLVGNLFEESGTMPVALVNGAWGFPPQSVDPPGYSLPFKKGSYRLIVRCLRFGRDENDASAWDSWMSGVIDVLQDVTFG